MALSERESRLLYLLTHQVRGISENQIAQFWELAANARPGAGSRAVQPLLDAGMLEVRRAVVRPLPPVTGPLWRSDDPKNFLKLEYEIQSRFSQPAKRVRVFRATDLAVRSVGGGCRKISRAQWQHDLHLSGVVLWLYQTRPDDAAALLGEDQYASKWGEGKLPDALCMRDGKPYLAVESAGGSYTAIRLKAFAEDMERRCLPCEVY